ncbi:MAG: aryl-sulfate sulfotransferase, partial [Myxococcota bacterium]
MSAVALATIVACSSPPPGRDSPIDSGGPTSSPTAETGTHAVGLSAACDPTDDPLRRRCVVHAEPPAAIRVRVARASGEGAERVSESASAVDHVVSVVFLAPDTDYDYRVEGVDDPTRAVSGQFRTGPLPDGLDSRLDVIGAASAPYAGVNFPCAPNAVAAVYDTATGEPVWMHDLDPEGRFGFEHTVRFTDEHTVVGDSGGRVVEVGLDGQVALELVSGVDYDELLHHDLFTTADHLFALHRIDGDPVLDGVVVFDRRTGARVAQWDPRDHLAIPADASGDWMHLNGLAVGADGALVLSSFTQSSVLAVEGDP